MSCPVVLMMATKVNSKMKYKFFYDIKKGKTFSKLIKTVSRYYLIYQVLLSTVIPQNVIYIHSYFLVALLFICAFFLM